ncbi:MAG: LytR/AlgR family response regulator transcription factor, partial [Saprospiraceae bacterium]
EIDKLKPQLLFIDVEMPNYKGFQVLKKLKYKVPTVVFVTAYADESLVNQALQYNCYSFLNKPIDQNTLKATLELARKNKKSTTKQQEFSTIEPESDNIIFIRNNNRLDRIDLREVAYVTSEGNYCTIFLDNNRKFIAKSSLTQLQNNYFDKIMVRIHRNHIVHLKKIETVNLSEKWVLVNGIQLPIGRRYQADFVNQLRTIK